MAAKSAKKPVKKAAAKTSTAKKSTAKVITAKKSAAKKPLTAASKTAAKKTSEKIKPKKKIEKTKAKEIMKKGTEKKADTKAKKIAAPGTTVKKAETKKTEVKKTEVKKTAAKKPETVKPAVKAAVPAAEKHHEKPAVSAGGNHQDIIEKNDHHHHHTEVTVTSPKKNVRKIKGYSKEDLEYFKKIILDKRNEIIEQLQNLREQMMDPTTGQYVNENSPYSLHMAEQGTDAMEREKIFLWAQRENKFLGYLDDALHRIENGTYGICIECIDEPQNLCPTCPLIAKERLAAVPHSQLCLPVKAKQEKR